MDILRDPDAGTILSSYDAFGKLLREVNGKGDTTTFRYDDIGRMIRRTDRSNDISYSYLNDTSHAAFGAIDSIYNGDKSLTEVYSYDSDYGMLLSESRISPTKTFTNTYTYDWLGRPLRYFTIGSYNFAHIYLRNREDLILTSLLSPRLKDSLKKLKGVYFDEDVSLYNNLYRALD